MLDLKAIREQPDQYKKSLSRKGVEPSVIDRIVSLDSDRRSLIQVVEGIKHEQKEAGATLPSLPPQEQTALKKTLGEAATKRKEAEGKLEEVDTKLQELMDSLPNPPHESVPSGKDDSENKVIRTVGEKPTFDFQPKEHWEIAEALGVLDTERAVKISGSRFYFLRGQLALLQQALVLWALQEVTKKGFEPLIPPFMTRQQAIYGTGYLSKDENYIVNPGVDDLYLIGTSEVPITSFHSEEILEASQLPLRYAGYSPCFRREAGSYGKDMKGMIRVHQFEKVEMVIVCRPEDSYERLEEIREVEEHILQQLELPYQVIDICTGDLGGSAAKKYDLEAWLPGQNTYREMTSTSNCTDYQSRRLSIRIRQADGSLVYAHTLNGTAVASRPLVAIIENFQQEDGSVLIPKVLQPFCGFERMGGRL